MNLAVIEARVADLDTNRGFDFVYDLLLAYGLPKASIDRLRKGSHNLSTAENEVLWRGKVFYRFVEDGSDLHALIDESASDPRVAKSNPRFLIVTDGSRLVASDRKKDDTLDVLLSELPSHVAFFLPWAGIEKAQLETLNYADIKAAEKMARLYDEIIKVNGLALDEGVHQLNVFFSRLLFCFFAEDTGVFSKGLFTNAVASLTKENGEDLGAFLHSLFEVLNTPPDKRTTVPAHFREFGYVNGKLFDEPTKCPGFSSKARRVLLECGTLDWSRINPDIFGSMIQAVVHPGQRQGLGLHYTSVENIMKVIRPLFLDSLQGSLDASVDSPRKLQGLLDRIGRIKFFDPACGSGNFLVIAYKELRRLEHQILQRIIELQPHKGGLFKFSSMKLENFFGIEIDDFAHEIATLSLWLAKHQMNVEFRQLFGFEIPLIPLKETGNIVSANAARLAWESVCLPGEKDEVYLLGNPPYQGGTKQTEMQKEDLNLAFEDDSVNKYLDYVSIWLYKGARFVMKHEAELGFVATNSVCQGNHVGILWPRIERVGAEISFAHAPFRWSNLAKGKAGVTCVVIGLSPPGKRQTKAFYSDGGVRQARHINAYLVPDAGDIVVSAAPSSLAGLPKMVFGSMPRDGGHLLLTESERNAILAKHPGAKKFIRSYKGAAELIDGINRYCLWISDKEAGEAAAIPEVRDRLDRVRRFRLASKAVSTRKYAETPHRFVQVAHRETDSIIVPGVSSERREYVPMDFLDSGTVISNLANAIYDAKPWVFGLVQSRMHMVWMRAVAGRLESRLRYSAELVYNTFPVPDLRDEIKTTLTESVLQIIDAREQFPEQTLAELYDPDRMPNVLRQAHQNLDLTVDRLYQKREFALDEERLELLFEMYEELRKDEKRGSLA